MDLPFEFSETTKIGALMRSHDWSGSALGSPTSWGLSLKTVVRLILDSKFPMFVAWGPELSFLYNDAYAEILGDKHPSALGAPFKNIWEEIWQDISPIIEAALQGKPSYFEDLPLSIKRLGYPEQAWFTFSYSPVHNDDGSIAGIYCSVMETTRIVRDRQLREFQLRLADQIHPLTSPDAIVNTAVTMLAAHLNAEGCWYAEIDDEKGIFHTKSGWFGSQMQPLPQSGYIDEFCPALLPTLRQGREFVCNDLTSDARTAAFAESFLALGIGSILIVPVLKDGRFAFNINVTKPIAYSWTKEDIQAAHDVVDRTWIAMENAIAQRRLELERGQSDHILNQMDEGFMVVGADHLTNRINAEGLRLFRCSPEAVLAKPYTEPWPKEIKNHVILACSDVARSGTASVVELSFKSDSTVNWLELRISSLGEKGLTIFFRDITAHRQASLALRRSDKHFASIFEQTAAGIAERDLNGRLIRVNQRLCQILGRTREELLGVNIHQLTHPDDLARSEAAFKQLLMNGTPFDIEKRYIKSDNTIVWVNTTVSLIRIEGHEEDSVLAVILDISERKQAEDALQDETRILELLNRSGQSLASTLDVNTLLQTVTDSGLALTGAEFGAFFYNGKDQQGDAYLLYTLSGAPREAFEGFGHPRATPIFKPTFIGEAAIRSDDITKDPRYGKMAPHHGMPKGHLPVRSYLAVSVIARSGEVIGGLFFGHSQAGVFTERAERLVTGLAAQAAMAIDNARLYESAQKAAEERQTLLSNEQAARAEAERLNRSKDTFLAMLAHELRNPLSPVSAAAELLRIASNDPERVRQVSEILSRQIGHFTRLIDDLMDVSRVTRGLIELQIEPLDLNTIISVALEQVRPMIETKQHELVVDLDVSHPSIMGDRTRMVQVIANLLTNASRYTPPKGQISVSTSVTGDDVQVSVSDNGIGIDASLLPYVFDLFTQGTRNLDRSQGGLGIGLALVKAIVQLHHGKIKATSDGAGEGSTFTLAIPRASNAKNIQQATADMDVAGSGLSILLVDDNIDAAEVLAMLLEAVGHRVLVAFDATSAIDMAKQERIDVFVLDIGLPDMNGYDLAKTLRRSPELASKTYIALSGYGQPQDRRLSEEAGFTHHLVKPVDHNLLFKVLAGVKAEQN